MRIAVAGGTGTLGRHIASVARERGHDVVVLTRRTGVDLIVGTGVDVAVDGCDAVVDAANVSTLKAEVAGDFFRRSTGTLASAAERHGARNLVVVSIVGVDSVPYGYYAGKLVQERTAEESGAPLTIVRATQFHEFAGQVLGQASVGPIHLAPRAPIQPASARSVAEHLVTVAEGPALGRAQDVAGPQVEQLADLIRRTARAQGRRGPVIPVNLPNKQMKGMRDGLALPDADAHRVGPTFTEWLAAQHPSQS